MGFWIIMRYVYIKGFFDVLFYGFGFGFGYKFVID